MVPVTAGLGVDCVCDFGRQQRQHSACVARETLENAVRASRHNGMRWANTAWLMGCVAGCVIHALCGGHALDHALCRALCRWSLWQRVVHSHTKREGSPRPQRERNKPAAGRPLHPRGPQRDDRLLRHAVADSVACCDATNRRPGGHTRPLRPRGSTAAHRSSSSRSASLSPSCVAEGHTFRGDQGHLTLVDTHRITDPR